jgi:hypothetical protein
MSQLKNLDLSDLEQMAALPAEDWEALAAEIAAFDRFCEETDNEPTAFEYDPFGFLENHRPEDYEDEPDDGKWDEYADECTYCAG